MFGIPWEVAAFALVAWLLAVLYWTIRKANTDRKASPQLQPEPEIVPASPKPEEQLLQDWLTGKLEGNPEKRWYDALYDISQEEVDGEILFCLRIDVLTESNSNPKSAVLATLKFKVDPPVKFESAFNPNPDKAAPVTISGIAKLVDGSWSSVAVTVPAEADFVPRDEWRGVEMVLSTGERIWPAEAEPDPPYLDVGVLVGNADPCWYDGRIFKGEL